ncbi:Adaptive-response sensory-kinase SasA [Candidatus Magnetaquicoccaceae bacterium FCR-1]|uniref:histidine kinase n=1 Tax=Candidatus Magnetaquiglobus chichijimensis TaxID=3141448 RepID=A0ABQ0CB55_9PROT
MIAPIKIPETARMLLLMGLMAAVGLIMSGIAIVILYDTAFTENGQRLKQAVESYARLIEAIARNEQTHIADHDIPLTSAMLETLVMEQVREAHRHFKGFGETGEFTMGRQEGDNIVFVLRHRHSNQDEPLPVPRNSRLAEPMRRALQGESGVMVGLDYRGAPVLAAHEPVAILNMGVVAKIDLDELRRPFIRAGFLVGVIGFLVFVAGTVLFYRIGQPMVRQLTETSALRESRQALLRVQVAMQETSAQLDSILRAADLAVVATDLKQRILYFNPEAEHLFGHDATRTLGETLGSLHPALRGDDLIQTLVEGTENQDYPLEICLQVEGHDCRLEAVLSKIINHDGELNGFLLLARDVTAARAAMDALILSERRYRLLIESANDAIFIADAKTGIILDANPMAGELVGRPVTDLIGTHQTELHPEREREHYAKLFQSQIQKGSGLVTGILVVRQDGSEVPVEIRAAVTDLGDQQVILGIFRDVTERIRLEQRQQALNLELEQRVEERTRELNRSNLDLQQFAYVASHDLQEPLRLIAGFVQLLEKRYRGRLDDQADKYIASAIDGVNHMQSLIQNLLGYARVTNTPRELVEIDLNEVLAQTLQNLETLIHDTAAVVSHDPLPKLRADPILMGQLLQNMLGNALKFRGEDPPRIHLGATRKTGLWEISIADNGIGIEPRHQERIFLIFQKLHSRARYEGTGIGLALCRRIVELHGGQIRVESTPGRGSTFCFTIPSSGT